VEDLPLMRHAPVSAGPDREGQPCRPAPHLRRAAAAACLLALWTCGPANAPKAKLEGSLLTVMNLDYDDAVLSYDGTQFVVSFRRRQGLAMGDCVSAVAACDTPLAVTARFEPMGLPDGGPDTLVGGRRYDLTEVLSNGSQRGTVSRNVLDDPRRTFPPLRVGSIMLKNVPQQGQGLNAAGDFHVTFQNGVEFASGKTVFSQAFQAQFP
jgi:hypothetical protein